MTLLSRRPLEDSKALVCGVARNCGATLEESLGALRRATAGFRETRVLIVESDSTDATPQILARLSSLGELRAICLGNLRREIPSRTQRLAHCRNQLVEEVQSDHCRDVDFVLVADLDGVNGAVTQVGVESAWKSHQPWDVVTANQDGSYYDVWALRHPIWCPGDCWREYRQLRTLFGDEAAHQLAVGSRQMRLPPSAGFVEVESAFGGLGIYKRQAFIAGEYIGIDEQGEETCEHVSFHADLRQRDFRIFINAALINSSQREHLGRNTLIQKVRRNLRKICTG